MGEVLCGRFFHRHPPSEFGGTPCGLGLGGAPSGPLAGAKTLQSLAQGPEIIRLQAWRFWNHQDPHNGASGSTRTLLLVLLGPPEPS